MFVNIVSKVRVIFDIRILGRLLDGMNVIALMRLKHDKKRYSIICALSMNKRMRQNELYLSPLFFFSCNTL